MIWQLGRCAGRKEGGAALQFGERVVKKEGGGEFALCNQRHFRRQVGLSSWWEKAGIYYSCTCWCSTARQSGRGKKKTHSLKSWLYISYLTKSQNIYCVFSPLIKVWETSHVLMKWYDLHFWTSVSDFLHLSECQTITFGLHSALFSAPMDVEIVLCVFRDGFVLMNCTSVWLLLWS